MPEKVPANEEMITLIGQPKDKAWNELSKLIESR